VWSRVTAQFSSALLFELLNGWRMFNTSDTRPLGRFALTSGVEKLRLTPTEIAASSLFCTSVPLTLALNPRFCCGPRR
jgi:hypothetical protein